MLSFSVPEVELSIWMPILGYGIGFPIPSDTRLKSFLCDQIGIRPEYLEHRIQTILVNGRAIDEVQKIQIADGDVVALSAAMPGLVGTTLRMGSHLAEMRHDITHCEETTLTKEKQKGVVTLKLFNLVAKEIGPKLLDGPILLKQKDLRYLSSHYPTIGPLSGGTMDDHWEQIEIIA
jgi:hypothetical protein